jgi:uncharacterized protein YciI
MYFFVKTSNPRPTFHLDMTDKEKEVMANHVAFWAQKAKEGISVVFGPVADPKGVYGIGVYKVKGEDEMRQLLEQDPAKGLLTYTVLPMARAVVGHEVRYPDLA